DEDRVLVLLLVESRVVDSGIRGADGQHPPAARVGVLRQCRRERALPADEGLELRVVGIGDAGRAGRDRHRIERGLCFADEGVELADALGTLELEKATAVEALERTKVADDRLVDLAER